MTEIARKALALVNEVRSARRMPQFFGYEYACDSQPTAVAVAVRAIEQLEAEKAAHAKTLMENAALKEQLAIAREALKVYAGWDGKTARTALERIGDD